MTDPSAVVDTEAAVLPSARHRSSLIVLACVAGTVVVLDQISKHWVVATIQPRMESGEGPFVLLGGFLKLTYTENTGAAFSMGTGFTWVFSIIAVVVAIAKALLRQKPKTAEYSRRLKIIE